MEVIISARNWIIGFFYRNILKKIFFQIDPERIHDQMVLIGEFLGKFWIGRKACTLLFDYKNSILEQNLTGIFFRNPVGLAAGFDKNAQLTDILPHVGFGFMEIGSVTSKRCDGNPKPRLWRMKKSKSLLVYYGLKNDGCEKISERLKTKKSNIPIGISIAKTNSPETVALEGGVADYLESYKKFETIGEYFTINISCPNAYGGCPFTNKGYLERLLATLSEEHRAKPIFLKLSPDLSNEELDQIIHIARRYTITGFVSSNLTKNRDNKKIKDGAIPKTGGMSGAVVMDLVDAQIEYLYRKTQGEFLIIGCGGIFSAEDAYRKVRLGASLLQLITGMIYEGPQIISEINQGLSRLLKKDGFKSITEAIGVDNKNTL